MWLVYTFGARATYFGTVSAPDRKSALVLAGAEFNLAEVDRRRLIAQRINNHA